MEYDIEPAESVSEAVIRAVRVFDGRDPCSTRPLAAVVNPDALDALFAERNDGGPRAGGRVSFVYGHCRVTVDNGEFLTVQPLQVRPRPVGDGGLGVGDTE